MKDKRSQNFTKCQKVKVLTIKIQNKLWIFFQIAVPLHCQLAEYTQ